MLLALALVKLYRELTSGTLPTVCYNAEGHTLKNPLFITMMALGPMKVLKRNARCSAD